MLKQRTSKSERIPVIGHRGAPAHAPENTMSSFRVALEQGVDAIELDIHRSRDGELVVIHEFTVDFTTDGSGYVKDMTLAELKELDAGSWFSPAFAGERIPTLPEVLEWVRGKVGVAIRSSPSGSPIQELRMPWWKCCDRLRCWTTSSSSPSIILHWCG